MASFRVAGGPSFPLNYRRSDADLALVRAKIETACLCLVAILASTWLAYHPTYMGDYAVDSGPTIHQLVMGHLHAALDQQPAMGPVSILLRAPFAWLLGAGNMLDEFRAGSLPCLLVAGAVGIYVARRARAAGRSFWIGLLIVGLAVLNPANLHAIGDGHPEEILGAALCVAAVFAAGEGRSILVTGTLLGLAVGTKQWAILAIGPVLLAAPRGRIRVGLLAVGIAVLLTVPLALGNPTGFEGKARAAADASVALMPDNVWYPFAHVRHVRIFDGVAPRVIEKRYLPRSISAHAKPFVILLGLLLPLILFLRARRRPLRPEDPLLLLALLFALRCALDPISVAYYHAPLLMALIAYEGLYRRGSPLLSMVASLVLWSLTVGVFWVIEPQTVMAIYLGWMVPLLAYLGTKIYAPSVINGLGNWLSTRAPSSLTMTRSSIRTPNAPGR
jgi:hypothetical protein